MECVPAVAQNTQKEIAKHMELNAATVVNVTTTPKCAVAQIINTAQMTNKVKNRVAEGTRRKTLRTCRDKQDRRRIINTAEDEFDTLNKMHAIAQKAKTLSMRTSLESYST